MTISTDPARRSATPHDRPAENSESPAALLARLQAAWKTAASDEALRTILQAQAADVAAQNIDFRLDYTAALQPLLAADRAAELYPEVEQKTSEHNAFCPEGNGALFRYKDRDLWCVARHDGQFVIAFPDKTRWTVSPIKEEQ